MILSNSELKCFSSSLFVSVGSDHWSPRDSSSFCHGIRVWRSASAHSSRTPQTSSVPLVHKDVIHICPQIKYNSLAFLCASSLLALAVCSVHAVRWSNTRSCSSFVPHAGFWSSEYDFSRLQWWLHDYILANAFVVIYLWPILKSYFWGCIHASVYIS